MKTTIFKIRTIVYLFIATIFITSSCTEYNDREDEQGAEVIDNERTEIETESTVIQTLDPETQDTSRFEEKLKQESSEIKTKLESLRVKAKEKGSQVDKEVDQFIVKLDKERQELEKKDLSNELQDKWSKFKTKANAAIDSLDKKI